MDTELLRHVGQIAGLGGLALGVLLLVFREVLRKNIFPDLARAHAYRIIRLIVVLTFAIAAVGIGAWVLPQASRCLSIYGCLGCDGRVRAQTLSI
jgi:hypothetical protein